MELNNIYQKTEQVKASLKLPLILMYLWNIVLEKVALMSLFNSERIF